ncbi:cytochrome c peroxidase [Microvirga mediterraneensis]|uniref:Cupredoxin domain-containing protein n=1 Tax=Microvirga mediterraneensis TaxID=2754695 RepID=A0A838BV66_9HYPH|nr:cytochrome c peroxidase [Microvirga mediterraneensis]MBA1158386.1 cupredoxin domain-containing protein [Microvirga mediterraneensis]
MPRESLARIGRVLAGLVLASLVGAAADRPAPPDAAHWRQAFARPDHAPTPADNPASPEKIALGAKLFEDTRLSGSGDMACSSCHQADLSFSDGVDRHLGHDGQPLDRRTPPLWNLAWGLSFFWDGRAASLEAQAMGPIENEREMAGNLQAALRTLDSDPPMRKAFAAAFPDDPAVTQASLAKALAAFQRTLVSPETRFDRWVKGDDAALEADELAGFSLFVGKAGCVACHQGWRFTDEAFHDIGLASDDKGRGPVLGVSAANHAFKTPSLRERVWSAPYMHDGSLATFDDVVTHYAENVVQRPTLSADLPRRIELNDRERAQLVAFLNTLSSDDPPRPASLPSKAMSWGTDERAIPTSTVSQKDRRFTPGAVLLKVGEALRIVNDDTRVHNVRLDAPGKSFNSDGQNPGDTVTIGFDQPGHYDVICGIHPDMRLGVEVAQAR